MQSHTSKLPLIAGGSFKARLPRSAYTTLIMGAAVSSFNGFHLEMKECRVSDVVLQLRRSADGPESLTAAPKQ